MKSLLLFFLTISASTHAWQQNDVSIIANGHTIHGSLAQPKNSDTVVLLIAGSGPTDRNGNQAQMKSNSYLMLAKALYQAGYASLRYDKRGIGASAEPKVDMNTLRFDDYVKDAALWVDELSKQFDQVVLMGHSIGGLMALQVAQQKTVKSVITLAGMASSGYDTLNRQLSDQPEFVTAAALPLLDRLSKGEDIPEADVPPYLMSIFHPNLQGYLRSFLHINPHQELAKVKRPVLVVIGGTDIQVTVSETEKMTKDQKYSQLVKIPDMNHVLKVAPAERMANLATYSQPELPLHEALMPALLAFLANP